MAEYIPGSTQLRAHADAARELSAARAHFQSVKAVQGQIPDGQFDEALRFALARIAEAKVVRDKAYLAYTNPFGVQKTV